LNSVFSSAAARCGRCCRYGCCRRYAELLFHRLNEFDDLHDAHVGDRVQNIVFGQSHLEIS
jgi:hypothetical protein